MEKVPVGKSIAHAYEFLFGRFFQIIGTAWLPAALYAGAVYLCFQTSVTWLAPLTKDSNLLTHGIVVTLGAEGCDIWQAGERIHVPGLPAAQVLDPTGCGDAFRSALLYGLERGWPLERCARLGNRLDALKIASRGGQNHVLDHTILSS